MSGRKGFKNRNISTFLMVSGAKHTCHIELGLVFSKNIGKYLFKKASKIEK